MLKDEKQEIKDKEGIDFRQQVRIEKTLLSYRI